MNDILKGPWIIRGNQQKTKTISKKEEGGWREICSVPGAFLSPQEIDSISNLIVAAPELLEVVKRLLKEDDGVGRELTVGLFEDAVAAVAKAEGK